MKWDPETMERNRLNEIKIAHALIEAAVETSDVDTMRRLNRAALIHLEQLDPSPAPEEEETVWTLTS